MNCQRFENIVNDLAREQIIEACERDRALAHSDECESCALKLEHQRALTLALRGLAAEMNSMETPVRVEDRLLAGIQSRTLEPPRRPTTRARRYWIGAAAAVLLIAFSAAAKRWHVWPLLGQEPKISEIVQTTSVPKPTPSVSSQFTSAHTAKQKPPLASLRSNSTSVAPSRSRFLDRNGPHKTVGPATATVATNYGKREIATGFLPMGFGDSVNFQDGGQIVRVELPRRALATFGLPVDMNRANERVKADVLLSSDGLAQAIRFVR